MSLSRSLGICLNSAHPALVPTVINSLSLLKSLSLFLSLSVCLSLSCKPSNEHEGMRGPRPVTAATRTPRRGHCFLIKSLVLSLSLSPSLPLALSPSLSLSLALYRSLSLSFSPSLSTGTAQIRDKGSVGQVNACGQQNAALPACRSHRLGFPCSHSFLSYTTENRPPSCS